jgi:hypothetical protein
MTDTSELREVVLTRCPCGRKPKLYFAGSSVYVLGCELEGCTRSCTVTCSSLAGAIGKWNRSVPLFREVIAAKESP